MIAYANLGDRMFTTDGECKKRHEKLQKKESHRAIGITMSVFLFFDLSEDVCLHFAGNTHQILIWMSNKSHETYNTGPDLCLTTCRDAVHITAMVSTTDSRPTDSFDENTINTLLRQAWMPSTSRT